jgi:hypothetical protein
MPLPDNWIFLPNLRTTVPSGSTAVGCAVVSVIVVGVVFAVYIADLQLIINLLSVIDLAAIFSSYF